MTGVYGCDPKMKAQFPQWKSPGSPCPKMARQSRNKIKTRLTVIFDWKGVQVKQLIRSSTSILLVGWEMQYNENAHSYGQLVIGSCIMTTHLLMHHVLSIVFWQNIISPRGLVPTTAKIWCPSISLGFSQNYNHLEREEISDHGWDSGN